MTVANIRHGQAVRATAVTAAALAIAALLALALALAGCGASNAGSGSDGAKGAAQDSVITVGASPSPHAEILAAARPVLEEAGYTLEVREFSDYVLPNVALADGSLDANFFQHQPYLDNYNEENGTDLVSAAVIHFEPMTLYAGKTASLAAVPDGATIAVPADATNEARALLLLEDQGIIKVRAGAGLAATANDIVDNPHNVKIVEVEAAALPRQLEDTDFAVINGNFALSSGLDAGKALAAESSASAAAQTYGNVVAVAKQNADSDKTKALVKALQSDTVRDFIASNYDGAVVALF